MHGFAELIVLARMASWPKKGRELALMVQRHGSRNCQATPHGYTGLDHRQVFLVQQGCLGGPFG